MSKFVETTSRLAQWRIDSFPTLNIIMKSDPFSIGKWNWCLCLFLKKDIPSHQFFITLRPKLAQDSSLIASFNIRVVSLLDGRKILFHREFRDEPVKNSGVYLWNFQLFQGLLTGRFNIDVEFLDLKTASPNGGEPLSIWSNCFTQKDTNSTSLSPLARMLSESIHTDITIHASNGSIGAHRAVLAACSSVFRNMFSHDLKEKEMSTINISDMSIEACKAFLNYIYSNFQYPDFFNHRLDLLRAADKYDISDLKNACQESLIEDIDTKNVLERLQIASLYSIPTLKASCLTYLVKFGRIHDIQEEFEAFIQSADRELIGEVLKESLSV